MNDEIFKRMVIAVMERCANGRPLVDVPSEWIASGPCPHCLHRIDPSEVAIKEKMPGQSEKEEWRGVVVCGGCRKPLMFTKPGKFKAVPRHVLRQFPKSTRLFIEKNQELILSIQKRINN